MHPKTQTLNITGHNTCNDPSIEANHIIIIGDRIELSVEDPLEEVLVGYHTVGEQK